MPVNPVGMTLRQWADALILTTDPAFSFGRLDDDTKWQDWAAQFVRATPYSQRNVPSPYFFTDWRQWAERSYTMLEGA